MLAGSIRFPVFSPATEGLLAGRWKAYIPSLTSTFFNAQDQKLQYSTIADAMLGRAAKAFEPPTSKNDLAKQLLSSSPAQNGNIEEQFKKARQSIGGFTSFTNSSNPLRSKSPNISQGLTRKTTSVTSIPPSSGLPSVLSNQNSFQDASNIVDLTGENPINSKVGAETHFAVNFDENDFEDDADLDFDIDYEIPSALSMGAPPKPSQRPAVASASPHVLPQLQRPLPRPSASQSITSSAQTWSSSSPSHKLTPPGARARRQREELVARESTMDPITEADFNPPPRKRRTLPWAQRQAERDELVARMEEIVEASVARRTADSSPPPICFRCNEEGHFVNQCPNSGNRVVGSKGGYTPLPNKNLPWNTTASAVKEQQRVFKDKQKATRKVEERDLEAVQSHNGSKAVIAPLTLSDEQLRVVDLVVNKGQSVFFTGSAGTGKSVLMRAIITELRKKYIREGDRVAVTASTGLAACNIGGVTLHSFGGIGLGKEDVATLVKKIRRNQKAKNRWLRTKVLIIDEISMVDGDLFDKLEGIARSMRNNGRPFGGIQLVITGDFFQLPPVPDLDNKARGAKFAFDAATWSSSISHTIGLTEVFRQKDPVFANMLNEMRLGKITDETVQAFRKLSRKITYEDSLDATELFPTRNEVDNSNAFRMRDLHGKSYKFEAKDTGTIQDLAMRDKLLSNMMAPKMLELKKGAQVMLIKNMDDGLVNGSLGKIIAFMNENTFEIYDTDPDILNDGVALEELDESARQMRTKLKNSGLNKDLIAETGREFPLVRFSVADGTTRDLLVLPEDWKVELPNGEVQAQRSQLPLILAWALSIHKAQGQTLERVKIDLKKIFEKGQAYVALSRATSQAGLEVQNFDKRKVMAHPRVAEFYDGLYSVHKALKHPKVAKPPNPTKRAATYEKGLMKNKEHVRGDVFDDDEEAIAMAYG